MDRLGPSRRFPVAIVCKACDKRSTAVLNHVHLRDGHRCAVKRASIDQTLGGHAADGRIALTVKHLKRRRIPAFTRRTYFIRWSLSSDLGAETDPKSSHRDRELEPHH
jgi:hypothetical protein